ncbi:DUF3899 domain-containing protein [Paraliobacillus salinarum]|uniref:DUF3899 domain-containing protein n=1 Tax=Paraliobacillus salinarum TaxID=1158996 RepID=UPI0015F3E8E2|nr:DUF3899 domain-containing protein [Paraliobacillus salinarum]
MQRFKKMNSTILILLINLFVIMTISIIKDGTIELLYLINTIFYFFVGYLLLWLTFMTIHGGFFDGVTYGFRKASGSIFKKNYSMEWDEKPLPSKRVNEKLVSIFRFQAIGLGCIMSILLVFYYM